MSEPAVRFNVDSDARNIFSNRLFHTSNETTPASPIQSKLANFVGADYEAMELPINSGNLKVLLFDS